MELKISEAIISTEIKNQPSKYGFLLLLHKKLLTAFEEAKLKRGKIIGMLTLEGKEKLQPHTNRPFTDDMVKAWVESHKKYLEASQACIAAKDAADAIYACVKGFEQRKDLLQTLSSNQRNER